MSPDRQDRAFRFVMGIFYPLLFRSLSPVGKYTVHKKVEKTKSLIAEKRRELEELTIANQSNFYGATGLPVCRFSALVE